MADEEGVKLEMDWLDTLSEYLHRCGFAKEVKSPGVNDVVDVTFSGPLEIHATRDRGLWSVYVVLPALRGLRVQELGNYVAYPYQFRFHQLGGVGLGTPHHGAKESAEYVIEHLDEILAIRDDANARYSLEAARRIYSRDTSGLASDKLLQDITYQMREAIGRGERWGGKATPQLVEQLTYAVRTSGAIRNSHDVKMVKLRKDPLMIFVLVDIYAQIQLTSALHEAPIVFIESFEWPIYLAEGSFLADTFRSFFPTDEKALKGPFSINELLDENVLSLP